MKKLPVAMPLFVAVYVVSLLFTSVFSQTSQYLGCYQDGVPRKLNGEYKYFPYQSKNMCLNYCKRWNFKYAGAQSGIYCFCGDEEPLVSDKRSEIECNINCPGQPAEKCGGSLRNAIYSTGMDPDKNEYVGCYLDESNRRLKGYYIQLGDMAPRACINRCRALHFKYAGLQAGIHCFCGNEDPNTADKKSESECSIICPLDPTRKCGGSYRNSIYRTLVTWDSTYEYRLTDYTYMGCYQDSGARRLRGEYIYFPYMTQQMCLSYCKKRRFRYAGLQTGIYCYCGDEKPLESDKKPESECYSNCPGEVGTKCGGPLRNAIYQTGEEPFSTDYVGCFIDEISRKLNGFFITLNQMTQRSCIDRCRNMNFKYAGLQIGNTCFCGDTDPLSGDERPEINCFVTCPGDYTRRCGGAMANSIYRTYIENPGNKPVINPVP